GRASHTRHTRAGRPGCHRAGPRREDDIMDDHDDHTGHRHEWHGKGRGQIGDPGVRICREHPDGRTRVQRCGYLRPLPGGGLGWVEEPWRVIDGYGDAADDDYDYGYADEDDEDDEDDE